MRLAWLPQRKADTIQRDRQVLQPLVVQTLGFQHGTLLRPGIDMLVRRASAFLLVLVIVIAVVIAVVVRVLALAFALARTLAFALVATAFALVGGTAVILAVIVGILALALALAVAVALAIALALALALAPPRAGSLTLACRAAVVIAVVVRLGRIVFRGWQRTFLGGSGSGSGRGCGCFAARVLATTTVTSSGTSGRGAAGTARSFVAICRRRSVQFIGSSQTPGLPPLPRQMTAVGPMPATTLGTLAPGGNRVLFVGGEYI